MLNALRRRADRRRAAQGLVKLLVQRARAPVFYEKLRVADTVDGRFDVLVLHAWLVLDRLGAQGARDHSQAFVDGLFVQFDEALREQGAGDMGMSRRMTKMADAFYGRLKAYGEAADGKALSGAIVRNVFRGDARNIDVADALSMYAMSARARLATADLTAGDIDFGPEP